MAGRIPAGVRNKSTLGIASWALIKGATRNYPDRLVSALVARGFYEYLQEFRDSPVFEAALTRAMRRRDPESMLLAWNFIRSGKTSFLPVALEWAAELARKPASVAQEERSRLIAACKLIIDYGSESQLDAVAASLRDFQTSDEAQHRSLWQAIDGSENKRALRLDAIVITDRRMLNRDVRYCDAAAGDISRLSGEIFYAGRGASVMERDERIARAISWLKFNKLM
jgi:hypothetical protein